MKPLVQTLFLLLTTLVFVGPVHAGSMSQLPMSQPNFQGFVPERSRHEDERELDPNLVRLMVHPSLYWVTNSLLDAYQEKHPESRFRIHQGYFEDLIDRLEDNYVFDLLLNGEIAEGMKMIKEGRAAQTRVLAMGRVGLWAPKETVRSLRVLTLRDDPIGLMHESSPYHRAAREILDRGERLEEFESRLVSMRLGEDLFTRVNEGRLPAGFIEWQRLIQEGIHQRREVMQMPANHHGPIIHSATLMREGQQSEAAQKFWEFLFTPQASRILRDAGFD